MSYPLLILFISMHKSDTTLELGALAIALTSSIFALIAYAILEGLKIRLYTRLMLCLREVQNIFDGAGQRPRPSEGSGSGAADLNEPGTPVQAPA
jgi:hypothetical protein